MKASELNKIVAHARIESALEALDQASNGTVNRELYHDARHYLAKLRLDQSEQLDHLVTEDDT